LNRYLRNIDLSDYFWLSRDKIASTIPGSSLISPHIQNVYLQLNQNSLSDTVSKKLIKENVAVLSDTEAYWPFLEFSSQMLIRNPQVHTRI